MVASMREMDLSPTEWQIETALVEKAVEKFSLKMMHVS